MTAALAPRAKAKPELRAAPGGSSWKNLTADFAQDFTNSKTTLSRTRFLRRELAKGLNANPPTVATKAKVDLISLVPAAIGELNDPNSPEQMDFNLPGEVPGNLAGVIGDDQTGFNRYDTDAPGNIFYWLVGKYAGWNELTIKLGSQLAEFIDDKRAQIGWDTADDVKVLALGHSWQLPLDQGQFCSGVQGTKLKLAHQPECRDCLVPFTPQAAGTAGKVRRASAGARATEQ